MYCGKCGAEIQEGVKFCANCGAQCNVSDVEHKKTNHDKMGKSKKKIGIVLLVVLVLLFVAGGFFLRSTEKHSETSKNDTEQTTDNKTSKPEKSDKEEALICPQFIGQTVDSISNNEDYQDSFQIDIVWEYNDDYDYGHVYAQSVTESTAISEGSSITLYVSKGADIRYEEVAKRYATAIVKSDYSNINEYLPYNADNMIEFADYDSYEQGLDVTATVVNTQVATEAQIVELLDDIIQEWNLYGFCVEDYIDSNKINKGYLVDVRISVYEPADNERWGSETFTYTIINYDGTWKVLTDFITDRDEMYEAW